MDHFFSNNMSVSTMSRPKDSVLTPPPPPDCWSHQAQVNSNQTSTPDLLPRRRDSSRYDQRPPKVPEEVLQQCPACPLPGLVPKFAMSRHLLQAHRDVIFKCAVCEETEGRAGHFLSFQDTQDHVMGCGRTVVLEAVLRTILLPPAYPQSLVQWGCSLCTQEGRRVFLDESLAREHIGRFHSEFYLNKNRFGKYALTSCRVCGMEGAGPGILQHIKEKHPRHMFADSEEAGEDHEAVEPLASPRMRKDSGISDISHDRCPSGLSSSGVVSVNDIKIESPDDDIIWEKTVEKSAIKGKEKEVKNKLVKDEQNSGKKRKRDRKKEKTKLRLGSSRKSSSSRSSSSRSSSSGSSRSSSSSSDSSTESKPVKRKTKVKRKTSKKRSDDQKKPVKSVADPTCLVPLPCISYPKVTTSGESLFYSCNVCLARMHTYPGSTWLLHRLSKEHRDAYAKCYNRNGQRHFRDGLSSVDQAELLKLECKKCPDQQFSTWAELGFHRLSVHLVPESPLPVEPYCRECLAPVPDTLRSHLAGKEHRQMSQETVECGLGVCGARVFRDEVQVHRGVRHSELGWSCGVKGCSFVRYWASREERGVREEGAREWHMEREHEGGEEEMRGKTFKSRVKTKLKSMKTRAVINNVSSSPEPVQEQKSGSESPSPPKPVNVAEVTKKSTPSRIRPSKPTVKIIQDHLKDSLPTNEFPSNSRSLKGRTHPSRTNKSPSPKYVKSPPTQSSAQRLYSTSPKSSQNSSSRSCRSPPKRYRSPSGRGRKPYIRSSRSPKRKTRSPRRSCRSPIRGSTSRRRNSSSPRRSSWSPRRKCSRSPLRSPGVAISRAVLPRDSYKIRDTSEGILSGEEGGRSDKPGNGKLKCLVCQITCPGSSQMEDHIAGKKHKALALVGGKKNNEQKDIDQKRNVQKVNQQKGNEDSRLLIYCKMCKLYSKEKHFSCPSCDVHTTSKTTFLSHIAGTFHIQQVTRANSEVSKIAFPDSKHCPACDETFEDKEDLMEHLICDHKILISCKECKVYNYKPYQALTCTELFKHLNTDHNKPNIVDSDLKYYGEVPSWSQGFVRCSLCIPDSRDTISPGVIGFWLTSSLDKVKLQEHFKARHPRMVNQYLQLTRLGCQVCSTSCLLGDKEMVWTRHLGDHKETEGGGSPASIGTSQLSSPCNFGCESVVADRVMLSHVRDKHMLQAFQCMLCPEGAGRFMHHSFFDILKHMEINHKGKGLMSAQVEDILFPTICEDLAWVTCKSRDCRFRSVGLAPAMVKRHLQGKHGGRLTGGLQNFNIFCRICDRDEKSVITYDDPQDFTDHMRSKHEEIFKNLRQI